MTSTAVVTSPAVAAGASVGKDVEPVNTPPTIRRVSYVVKDVAHAPRYFSLPPLSSQTTDFTRSKPLLVPSETSNRMASKNGRESAQRHSERSKHRLPISSLALDATTCLAGQDSPAGILYMGGRDGMVSAWELNLPMQRRKRRRGHLAGDMITEGDEDNDETLPQMSGTSPNSSWEVDASDASSPGPARYRQCIGSHTDWINDVCLVNDNQTVISASSDRTVNLWNPHDANSSSTPKTLGSHMDYVRALTYARQPNWIASGSFDRTIKLWDLQEVRKEPILTLAKPQVQSSIYALATNASGSVIVGATPEKYVRAWDPRSGTQIAQLIGHSDAVRDVVVSADGLHVLSASSDCTIRLWNLAEQRCLHTFAHHSDSVWSLFSEHPNLDVFYSGDRSGYVCKVDWERCAEVGEGECVVLAHESAAQEDEREGFANRSSLSGINKIVALDNSYFWTATSNGSVSRWKDVASHSWREALYPVAEDSSAGLQAITETPAPTQARESTFHPIPSQTSSVNPRISALRSQQQSHRTSSSVSSVSFAGMIDEKEEDTSYQRLIDTPTSESTQQLSSPQKQVPTLFGLPFSALVCLAPANDPYAASLGPASISTRLQSRQSLTGYGSLEARDSVSALSMQGGPRISHQIRREADGSLRSSMQASRQHSASLLEQASLLSSGQDIGRRDISTQRPPSVRSGSLRFVPHLSSSYEDGATVDMDRGTIKEKARSLFEDFEEARQAFEEREVAVDATPLRSAAEDVIRSSEGMVRCALLNDRKHCLTMDSAAEVRIWNIISATCVGAFHWDEVLAASRASGFEGAVLACDALDVVRDRIQGSNVVPNWCEVDTRIGSLTVHLQYPRCFDADIYTEDLADLFSTSESSQTLSDESRANIGLTVLTNLFKGFVAKEQALRLGSDAPIKDGALAYEKPEISNRILVSGSTSEKLPLRLKVPGTVMSPGMTIGIAETARTPANLVAPSPLTPSGEHGMSSLQKAIEDQLTASAGKELAGGTTPTTPSDYFSIQRNGEAGDGASTPKSKTPGPSALSPGSSAGLMGRLRMSRKREASNPKRDGKTQASTDGDSDKPQEQTASASDGNLEASMTADQLEVHKQLQRLRALLARKAQSTDQRPNIPKIKYDEQTSVILSESTHDSGSFKVGYRGLVASTQDDAAILELHAPMWLLEYLIAPSVSLFDAKKEKDKISFVLVPWKVPAKPDATMSSTSADLEAQQQQRQILPPLSSKDSTSKLTTTPLLRMKKVCDYLAMKLDLGDQVQSLMSESTAASIAGSRRGSSNAVPTAASTGSASTASQSRAPLPNDVAKKLSTITPEATPDRLENAATSGSPDAQRQQMERKESTGPESAPLPLPADYIEILCKGHVVPPQMTLAQVQRYVWKSGPSPQLEYRLREPAP